MDLNNGPKYFLISDVRTNKSKILGARENLRRKLKSFKAWVEVNQFVVGKDVNIDIAAYFSSQVMVGHVEFEKFIHFELVEWVNSKWIPKFGLAPRVNTLINGWI